MYLYIDMDDVLVHLNVKIAESLGMSTDEMYSKWKRGAYDASAAFGVSSEEIWSIAFREKDFWGDLPAYSWAKDLWNTCNNLGPSYILTAPIYSVPELVPICLSGKIKWLHRFTDNPKFENYVITRHKSHCAKWNHILIDDREKNINEFEAAGGVGVLFPAIGNKLHEHRKEAYSYILPELHEKVDKIKKQEAANILEA